MRRVNFKEGMLEKSMPFNDIVLRLLPDRSKGEVVNTLFSDLDSSGTVESYELLTHVNEVAVVDSSIELVGGYTGFQELFFNRSSAVFAEVDIDTVVTSIVVSPASYDILGVGVSLHHFSASVNYAHVGFGKFRHVDGEVDSSEGSSGSSFDHFGRTVQASLELSFEVGDASIGGLQASAESVAVLGFGANGHDRSVPFAFGEQVSYAEVGREVVGSFVPFASGLVAVVVESSEANVERKLNTLAQVEAVDDTATSSEDIVFGVLVG